MIIKIKVVEFISNIHLIKFKNTNDREQSLGWLNLLIKNLML